MVLPSSPGYFELLDGVSRVILIPKKVSSKFAWTRSTRTVADFVLKQRGYRVRQNRQQKMKVKNKSWKLSERTFSSQFCTRLITQYSSCIEEKIWVYWAYFWNSLLDLGWLDDEDDMRKDEEDSFRCDDSISSFISHSSCDTLFLGENSCCKSDLSARLVSSWVTWNVCTFLILNNKNLLPLRVWFSSRSLGVFVSPDFLLCSSLKQFPCFGISLFIHVLPKVVVSGEQQLQRYLFGLVFYFTTCVFSILSS